MTNIKTDERVFRKVVSAQVEKTPAPAPKETKPKKAASGGKKGTSKS